MHCKIRDKIPKKTVAGAEILVFVTKTGISTCIYG